jgi:hypothetical protein
MVGLPLARVAGHSGRGSAESRSARWTGRFEDLKAGSRSRRIARDCLQALDAPRIVPTPPGPTRAAVHLATRESLSMCLCLAEPAPYELVPYINDNFGPAEVVEVSVDGQRVGQVTAEDSGAWEVRASTCRKLSSERSAVTVDFAEPREAGNTHPRRTSWQLPASSP